MSVSQMSVRRMSVSLEHKTFPVCGSFDETQFILHMQSNNIHKVFLMSQFIQHLC